MRSMTDEGLEAGRHAFEAGRSRNEDLRAETPIRRCAPPSPASGRREAEPPAGSTATIAVISTIPAPTPAVKICAALNGPIRIGPHIEGRP
jgi:hypothetical protein